MVILSRIWGTYPSVITIDPHSSRVMIGGGVGAPSTGAVGMARGVEVAVGLKVGVLVGVGGTGVDVGGSEVGVDEAVDVGV